MPFSDNCFRLIDGGEPLGFEALAPQLRGIIVVYLFFARFSFPADLVAEVVVLARFEVMLGNSSGGSRRPR